MTDEEKVKAFINGLTRSQVQNSLLGKGYMTLDAWGRAWRHAKTSSSKSAKEKFCDQCVHWMEWDIFCERQAMGILHSLPRRVYRSYSIDLEVSQAEKDLLFFTFDVIAEKVTHRPALKDFF